MKNTRATLAATAIPLLLTSLPLMAGELPFNAPATAQAKDSAPLLHQTAQALHDSPDAASGNHISNLWLFPTADGETVFARYNLTSASGAAASATEHLTVLTVRGNRIVESRELTSVPAEVAGNEPTKLHWTAFIGTGESVRQIAKPTHASEGTSASPDWTASIGSGTAASNTKVIDTKQTSSLGTQTVAASADWTSRIGTGHAADSGKRVMYASMVSSR